MVIMTCRFGQALLDQRGQQGDCVGMQTQFGLVDQNDRRPIAFGLQQKRCQCDEAQGPVGQRRRIEVRVRSLVTPFQTDFVRVQLLRFQLEVVEKRGHPLYRPPSFSSATRNWCRGSDIDANCPNDRARNFQHCLISERSFPLPCLLGQSLHYRASGTWTCPRNTLPRGWARARRHRLAQGGWRYWFCSSWNDIRTCSLSVTFDPK